MKRFRTKKREKNGFCFQFVCSIGYDGSCLKKAICELARHPLHNENDEEHLLIEIINFVLTYVFLHIRNGILKNVIANF